MIVQLRHPFLLDRVMGYWNKLPVSVKLSKDVDNFKNNLENFKLSSTETVGHFWDLSRIVLEKIEVANYLKNK